MRPLNGDRFNDTPYELAKGNSFMYDICRVLVQVCRFFYVDIF